MKKSLLILLLLIYSISNFGQTPASANLKNEALAQMKAGRFGEAIELISRFISSNPQLAEGFNIRGLCYEKRGQYEQAVYDFRVARKLNNTDKEVGENLNRTTKAWYALLYNKIEGHKREIAIKPSFAVNYLEIGKSYKNLGEWLTAEEWYDKYLNLEEASADEIIRYTEILAKNNHIAKGEPILKRYVEKYPRDHRLWSRYGYFTLWLGKRKIAIEAFETALEIRPFFREAQDGLDIALGKGHTYTINDTTALRFNQRTGQVESRKQAPEYPIDRYYRIIRANPNDVNSRYLLIDELLKVNRFEEAFQQIEFLAKDSESARYGEYSAKVTAIRDSIYEARVEDYKRRYEANPNDQEVWVKLADYYAKSYMFDEAAELYEKYLEKNPRDTTARYQYSFVLAANREFFRAVDEVDKLLSINPSNANYKLLRAQLGVWLVQDLDISENYLNEILAINPNNEAALNAMISVNMFQRNFDEAENYLGRLRGVINDQDVIEKFESDIEIAKLRAEEDRLLGLLNDGRNAAAYGNYAEALSKFDEYLSSTSPTDQVMAEYADINIANENYERAFEIYEELLSREPDNFDLLFKQAQAYFATGDSIAALESFQRLHKTNPDDYFVNLYLGDSYMRMREFSKAGDVYDNLLGMEGLDTTQISMIKMRYGWMPPTGFSNFFASFPTYTMLSPYGAYYSDNFGYKFLTQGLRLDVGLTGFITAGVEAFRNSIASPAVTTNFNNLRWNLMFGLMPNTLLGFGIGKAYYLNSERNLFNIFFRYDIENKLNLNLAYSKADAAQALLSGNLVGSELYLNTIDINGSYTFSNTIKITADTRYLMLPDGNRGLYFTGRGGKNFYPDFVMGYEYTFTDFQRVSTDYFSPINFSSHSLWGELNIVKDEQGKFDIGGKIGMIPGSDFIIREVYVGGNIRLFERLTFQGRIGTSSTVQNDLGYSAFSSYFGMFWAL
jgi:tetratricopeptide (TPR) repeat protein